MTDGGLSADRPRRVSILGTRGVPGRHGGFETFAESLALHLVERGWDVTVYCQDPAETGSTTVDSWQGIRRVRIPVSLAGAIGTLWFDLKSIVYAVRHRDPLALVLGYNTAVFCLLLRLFGSVVVMNMDGIEWKRAKWGRLERAWLWVNERFGSWVSHLLVADHPGIKAHLSRSTDPNRIVVIPYGAPRVTDSSHDRLTDFELHSRRFAIVIARPEPENSILEIVSAFSSEPREHQLVVLGGFEPERNPYHREVMNAASDEVRFLGAIYDHELLAALRFHASLYVHGHTVGGTNPSLVEALGAGCAVLAHDNRFNRWVAGDGNAYFASQAACRESFGVLLADSSRLSEMRRASAERFEELFLPDSINQAYETTLEYCGGEFRSTPTPQATDPTGGRWSS